MKEKEKTNATDSVLKQALMEYEEVIKAAKEKLAENNSNELNGLIEKFLKESENKNEPFNKVGKESTAVDTKVEESTSIQKPIGEVVKEGIESPVGVNMKEASLSEVEAAFDNANGNDDFQVVRSDDQGQPSDGSENNFDLSSIELEIDEMMQEVNKAEQMQQQAQQPTASPTPAVVAAPAIPTQNDPMAKMKEMYEGMGKFLKEMEDMSTNQSMMNEFHSKMSEMYGESYKAQMDEAKIGELFSMYKKVKGSDAEKPASKVDETPEVAAAPAVEEGHGVSLSHNKHVGQESQPRIENGKGYAANRIRVGLQTESIQKKLSALLKENLALQKQLNNSKKSLKESTDKVNQLDSVKQLNEKYKSALEEYKVQLREMAVLNTNIAYTNQLFVNEGLALTLKDKEEIIKKFKTIGSIVESEKTYKKLVKELSETKKTIKESVEVVSDLVVGSSTANKLEESVNSSSADSEHINKILKYSGISEKKIV